MKLLLRAGILLFFGIAIAAPAALATHEIASVTVGAQTPNPVVQGNQATYAITTTWSGSGSTCTSNTIVINWTAPTGATAAFSPTTVSSSSTGSTLTITTTASTPAGTTPFTVTVSNPATGCTAANSITSSSANLVVDAKALTVTKGFGTSPIAIGGTSTMTITITNPSTTTTQTAVAISDTFPTGMVVYSTPGATNTCGGTFTANANAGSVSLTGGSIAASSSCALGVTVTATASGSLANTTGAASSTQGGTGGTGSATLVVLAPPTITKAFSPTSTAVNGTSAMTITITNPAANGVTIAGVAVADTFPSGMTFSGSGATTCTGATLTGATNGSNTFSLSGGSITSGSSCTVTGTVTDSTSGVATNTTGAVSSTTSGTGTTATATLAVENPPTITKAFNPTSVAVSVNSVLTLTITNPAGNTVSLTGLAVSDTFPSGLVVAATPGLANTCGGTVTGATAASTAISLSGGTVAASSSCAISVNVDSATVGTYSNTTGAVSATNGGTGLTANASLNVTAPPTITKAFGAPTIPLTGSTTLTLTITEPSNDTGAMNGIAVSDTFPTGLTVSATPGATNTCGGTFSPVANATSISLTGGSISTPGATCAVSVSVTGTTAGSKANTTGTVSSTNDGTGTTASATVVVVPPPTITKSFSVASTQINTTATLTLTITNPSTTAQSGVAVSDTLPTNMQVAATPNATNTCGGTFSAAAAATTISLTGGSLTASGSCAVSVAITSPATGAMTNTTGAVNSTTGGTGLTASASITFFGMPSQLVFTTQPNGGVAAATWTSQPKVSIEDSNGNVVTSGTGATDSITIAIGTNPGSGTLTCTNTTVTAAAGVATFAGCSINKSGTGYTLSATDNTNSVPNGTSATFNITPGTATQLAFTTEPSATATGGTAFTQQPVVSIEDAEGNVVTTGTQRAVTLAVNAGPGTLTCTTNPVTTVAGVATFAGCSLNLAGTYTLKTTNTAGLTNPVSTSIAVSIGPPAKLVFTTQPTTTAAASPISPSPAVSVEDAGGNVITSGTGSTDSISLAIGTNPGGSTLTGTTPVSAVNGVATFSGMSLNKVGTGYTLTATDGTNSLPVVTSSTFNITAGPAFQLAFTTQPGGGTGGVAWTTQPTVTVQDAEGNTVTTSTLSITLAIGTNPGGGALTCTANPKSATAGVDTFAGCKITLAGTGYTLTATATGVATATSNPFNITVGPATQLAFGVQPSTTTATQTITPAVTVLIEDAGGNLTMSTATVAMAIGTNPGGGTLSGTTSVAAVAGTATFSTLSINKSGTGYTLSATSSGLTTATSTTFNITAGTASQIAFTVQPTNESQGFPITPAVVVSVEDSGGNVVTTGTGATDSITITIGANPGASTLSGTTTVTAAAGAATFSTLSLNNLATGYTLVATDNTEVFATVTSTAFNVVTPSTNYTEPFNNSPAHGWTFTEVSCPTGTGGSCTNTATEDSTNCGPLGANGVGTYCVLAAATGNILSTVTDTAYVSNPATYTWQTLGVPANATVLTVQGSFWDKETSGTSCSTATAGLQIFASGGSPELTATDLVPLLSVTGDSAGVTHTGSVLNVTSSTASASGISIHFELVPTGAAFLATCDIYGDNVNLVVTYQSAGSGGSGGPKRRGQVIIGMNRQSDGTMAETWAYNVDLPNGATALTAADIKTLQLGKSDTVLDPATFANRNITVTRIKTEKD